MEPRIHPTPVRSGANCKIIDTFWRLEDAGVTAELDPPDPNPLADMDPLRRFGPPYQTFLLSILCIMFGN